MSEERGDREGEGSQTLSDTLRYINLAEVSLELAVLRGPIHLCACVSEEQKHGPHTCIVFRSQTYIVSSPQQNTLTHTRLNLGGLF